MEQITHDFAFRNSKLWIEYSHKRYLTLDEIRHRVGDETRNWKETERIIGETRKFQSIPFEFKSLDKTFFYFPADCIQDKISRIEKLGIKLYDRIIRNEAFAAQFIANAAVEEAITSAIYEGANSSRAMARQLIAEEREPKNKDEWMLINNYRAMNWINNHAQERIGLDSIQEIHSVVTQNTQTGDNANYIGKFRDDKVFVGPHEGVDYRKIADALNEAVELVTNNPRFIHPLVRGILLHYFTAYIHPFFDGNGRTARALFYFKAIKNDLRFVELLSISAYLKGHGKRYERTFENVVKHNGDMTYFVDYCLDSLLYALGRVEEKVKYLLGIGRLKSRYHLSDNQIMLLQRMALNKFRSISIEQYAADINLSREVARLELKSLHKLDLVTNKKSGKKFIYFVNSKKIKDIVKGYEPSISID